jgi:hypothetical protein
LFCFVFFLLIKDCDLVFTDNKLLSQEHAYIEKDDENRVWFVDTSKNGSLINLNTKIHNTVGGFFMTLDLEKEKKC